MRNGACHSACCGVRQLDDLVAGGVARRRHEIPAPGPAVAAGLPITPTAPLQGVQLVDELRRQTRNVHKYNACLSLVICEKISKTIYFYPNFELAIFGDVYPNFDSNLQSSGISEFRYLIPDFRNSRRLQFLIWG